MGYAHNETYVAAAARECIDKALLLARVVPRYFRRVCATLYIPGGQSRGI